MISVKNLSADFIAKVYVGGLTSFPEQFWTFKTENIMVIPIVTYICLGLYMRK